MRKIKVVVAFVCIVLLGASTSQLLGASTADYAIKPLCICPVEDEPNE